MSTPSTDAREVNRNALRLILADIQAGINERDLDRILRHLSDDAVVTYQNADVTRGKAEISAYFNKNFNGNSPIIKRFTIRGEVSAPAIFIGDTAVAYGTTHDEMELMTGRKFTLDGKWSATILNRQGTWLVGCLHFSTNVLNNSVLAGVKKLAWMGTIGGLLVGGLLSFIVARLH